MRTTSRRRQAPPIGRALTLALTFAALTASALTAAARGDDWRHWRGSHRDGKAEAPSGWTGSRWPLAEAWRAEVGRGASSPVIHDGRLYVCGWRDDRDTLSCLDAAGGRLLWASSYPSPLYGRHSTGDKGIYAGVCSTPELDVEAGRVYTLGIDGDLRCWALQDGRELWARNLYDDFAAPRRPKVGRSGLRDYGYTSSPLATPHELIVEVGAPQHGCLIGFDKGSGKVLWKSQNRQQAGHTAGPAPITVQGVPCAAVHNFEGLLVVRLDEGRQGETVAQHPWRTEFGNNIASAAVHGDSVLITSSYNHHRMARLQIALDGARKVWETDEASKVCTPVVFEGHVYWAWRQLTCLDWETGRLVFQGGRFGDAGSCIATSDGRLIVWGGSRGDLALVESAGRAGQYRQLALRPGLAGSDAWPHVALADGRIFCKDRDGRLVAVAIRGTP